MPTSDRQEVGSSLIGPLARAVLHEEDLDLGIRHPIGDDIGRARDDEFAGTADFAATTNEGIGRKQLAGRGVDRMEDTGCGCGIVLGNVVADCRELVQVSSGPDDPHVSGYA